MALARRVQWAAHRLELTALSRLHPLRYLFIEFTRRCNLACAYCGSDCSPKVERPELPLAEWKRLLGELAADYDPKSIMVAVTGGEPLLREDALELLSELGRLGFRFGMVSNGQLIDRELARRLVATGIGSISLSLDAPEATMDRVRGPGTHRKVVEAIGHLREAGYRGVLEAMSTLTKPAVAELEATRRMLAELKVSRWRTVVVMPIGRAARRADLLLDEADVRTLLDFVLAARADGKRPAPEFCEEGYLGDRYEGEVRPFLAQCLAGITVGGILCDGRIAACPELGEKFVQGDGARERFSEVWESRYQVFRDRAWTRKGACAECDAYGRCKGGSLHLYPEPGAEMMRCLYRMLG